MNISNIQESLISDGSVWNENMNKCVQELEQIPNTFYALFWLYKSDFIYVSPSITTVLGHDHQRFKKHGLVFFQTIIPPDLITRIYDAMYQQTSLIEEDPNYILSNNLLKVEAAVYNTDKIEIPVFYQASILDFKAVDPISYLLFCSWIDFRNLHNGELSEKKQMIKGLLESLKKEYINANFEKFQLFKKQLTLSPREIEIASLLAVGLNTKEIAKKLYISHYTVESHRKNLLQKLEAKNTAELVFKLSKFPKISTR